MSNRRILTQTTTIKNLFGGTIPALTGYSGAIVPSSSLEGQEHAQVGGGQYAYANGVTLFSAGKLGHVAPSPLFTAITDTAGGGGAALITDLPLNGDTGSNGKAYVVLKNSTVVRLNTTGDATEVAYTVTNAVSSYNPDILILKDLATTPVEYIVSTNEVTGSPNTSDVTCRNIDGTLISDTFLASTLSATALRIGVPHKIALAPDGSVCITDGSGLYQVSITGAISSATGLKDRLKFGPGWIATGITTWKGYLVVIGCKTAGLTRGQVRVWFWNMTDANFTSSLDISDSYANAIYSDGTLLIAFTNGRNASSKLWRYNGTDFVKQYETPTITLSANPTQGNIDSFQDGLLVGNAANGFCYLSRFFGKGFHPDAVVSDGIIQVQNIGMVKNLYTNKKYVGGSYGTPGVTYKIYYDSSTNFYVGGELRTRLFLIAPNATIKRVRIYYSQVGPIHLGLFRGYDPEGTLANDKLNLSVAASQVKNYFYQFDKDIPNVTSFYLDLQLTHATSSTQAANIEHIEVDWTANILHSAYAGD